MKKKKKIYNKIKIMGKKCNKVIIKLYEFYHFLDLVVNYYNLLKFLEK